MTPVKCSPMSRYGPARDRPAMGECGARFFRESPENGDVPVWGSQWRFPGLAGGRVIWITADMDRFLERDQDRALFDLPPRAASEEKKWDAAVFPVRAPAADNVRSVNFQSNRWPRRQSHGGTNSPAQRPTRSDRAWSSSGTYMVVVV